jgi:hypothetical protein
VNGNHLHCPDNKKRDRVRLESAIQNVLLRRASVDHGRTVNFQNRMIRVRFARVIQNVLLRHVVVDHGRFEIFLRLYEMNLHVKTKMKNEMMNRFVNLMLMNVRRF